MKKLLYFMLLSVLATPVASQSNIDKQQSQLEQLTKEIKERQNQLADAKIEKNQLQKALREADQAIGESVKTMVIHQQGIAQSQKELDAHAAKHQVLEDKLQEQKQQLAAQMRTAFMSGSQDHTALLLGNEDTSALERMMMYYKYLNQARIDAISTIATTEREIAQVIEQQQAQRDKQQALLYMVELEKSQLAKKKQQQTAALAQVEQELKQGNSQLLLLQEDQEILKLAIKDALSALTQHANLEGLAKQKGRLNWPTSGRLSKRFGSHRDGQLKWNGWLMTAPAGRRVRAINNGQVVFANWLRGFGLVIVVDHGKEYLSLYGHTQALMKQVGDRVRKGETIALTGNSGGLKQAGLYFEIRHKGRAVDPRLYLAKSG